MTAVASTSKECLEAETSTSIFETPDTSPTVETDSNAANTRLGNCEVCAARPAKYTCPRCEVKTCRLKCTQIHRKELECSGIRDRTKYIPLNKFSNLDLSSDYKLLEEISRSLQRCKTETYSLGIRKDNKVPRHLHRLRCAAHNRRSILKYLPFTFERHQINTTKLDFTTNVIYWHIDWIFPHSENLKLAMDGVAETDKLATVLGKYFVKQEEDFLQEKLQYYQSIGMAGFRVYLRAEEKPGSKYYELDTTQTIKENLQNKIIIEYPTMLVVNVNSASAYDVIDSDAEYEDKMDIDEKTPSGQAVIERILKRQESDESIYKGMKNLLFASESDIEDNH